MATELKSGEQQQPVEVSIADMKSMLSAEPPVEVIPASDEAKPEELQDELNSPASPNAEVTLKAEAKPVEVQPAVEGQKTTSDPGAGDKETQEQGKEKQQGKFKAKSHEEDAETTTANW